MIAACTPAPILAGDIEGVWLVEDREARVEIQACGDELCGRLVWLRDPLDEQGRVRMDTNNPDAALRERRILGLRILEGVRRTPDAHGVWGGGRIYDPESGRTYRCKLRRDGDGGLKLRGYRGISLLGRTTRWTRFEQASP